MKYLLVLAYIALSFNMFSTEKVVVYKFDIKDQIDPRTSRITLKAFAEAERLKCDYILIHMNTYGGMLDAADSIRTKILNSKIPVFVFIDNNAASAGALISIACDKIFMRKGANIGAATVVDQEGKVLPDKYQAYMRSMMRSTAESHGKDTLINGTDTIYKWKRDPMIAEAMVDMDIYIENIIDSGKVLTFTTNEAIANGYCEGKAENISEVISELGIKDYEIVEYKISTLESFILFLINPVVQGIIIMIIVGGIYFEIQSPGIGLPALAAVGAAILYFAPLYLEGLAENWEILIFVAGLVLVLIEIFAIPGFGVTGISGIALVVIGLSLSMVDDFSYEYRPLNIEIVFRAFLIVTVSTVISLILSIYLSSKILTSSRFSYLALHEVQNTSDGFIGVEMKQHELKGKSGIAYTVLRPSGKVMIDDETYDAISVDGFIEKGTKIKVIKYETGQIQVVKLIE
ncbi:MAG TPA: serine protease [Bacteroidales bacterium]|nr:serine protease [Bacteroidales bacterium]